MYAKALWSERPFLYATKTSLAWHSVCVWVYRLSIYVCLCSHLCVGEHTYARILARWPLGSLKSHELKGKAGQEEPSLHLPAPN